MVKARTWCINDEWGEYAYVTVNGMGGLRRPFITARIDMRREKDGSRMFYVIFWAWILSTFFLTWRVCVCMCVNSEVNSPHTTDY